MILDRFLYGRDRKRVFSRLVHNNNKRILLEVSGKSFATVERFWHFELCKSDTPSYSRQYGFGNLLLKGNLPRAKPRRKWHKLSFFIIIIGFYPT